MSNSSIDELRQELSDGKCLRLGFGCGNLYAGRMESKSIRLLETAIDSGVRYFDTARLYGHGQAEYLIGKLPRSKRVQIRIATKAGILPTHMSLGWHLRAKAAALAKRGPQKLSALFPAPPVLRPRFDAFATNELQRSVETSLRALKVERLDVLLLHECSILRALDPEVLGFLRGLQQAGKIGSFGTATSPEVSLEVAERAPNTMDVIQFKGGEDDGRMERIRSLSDAMLITHSHLSSRLSTLCARGANVDDEESRSRLAKTLLALALHENPDGIVLFSTSKPERIGAALETLNMSDEGIMHDLRKFSGSTPEGE